MLIYAFYGMVKLQFNAFECAIQINAEWPSVKVNRNSITFTKE